MLNNYVRIALRNLLSQKIYSAINVIGLALGMACCLIIALFVQDELSYDRYHTKADRIYRIVEGGNVQTISALPVRMMETFPEVENYVRLRGTAGIWMMHYGDKTFYEKQVGWADGTLFDVFSFSLIKGDPNTALRAPFSVVLTESTARKYFGTEDPMGKVIVADNGYANLTVTGILQDMPVQSHFTMNFIVSLSTAPKVWNSGDWALDNWVIRQFYAYILLVPGADIASVEAKIPALLETHLKNQGTDDGSFKPEFQGSFKPEFQALTDIHLYSHLENELGSNGDISYIYIMAAIALVVLVIASINFTNLTTARSLLRSKEVGIRKVVGAQRHQLIFQFLGESSVVSCCALIIALVMVWASSPIWLSLSGKALHIQQFFDPVILLCMVCIITLVGLFAGMYPALILSGFHPVSMLKGGRQMGDLRQLIRKGLVVLQFAISIILIVSTFLIDSQLSYLQNERFGLNKEQVIVTPSGMAQVDDQLPALKEKFLQSPRVLSVTTGRSIPGRSAGTGQIFNNSARIADRETSEEIELQVILTGFDYIETLDMELLAGRGPSPEFSDTWSLVLNEAAMLALGWRNPEEAIGQVLKLDRRNDNVVTGVVKNFQMFSLHEKIPPIALLKGRDEDGFMAIRIQGDSIEETLNYLDGIWTELLPDFPFVYTFLSDDFERLYQSEQSFSAICRLFTILTIVIACMGLFGLAAFTAEQRTKEIGVRKVLGASVPNLVKLLVGEFVILVSLANLLAWPIAYWAMDQWLQNFAYHIDMSLIPFFIAGMLALVIALLTVGLQSLKSANANPIDSLRYE